MSKKETEELQARGTDRVVPGCCKNEFLWMKPRPNTYGSDMPKFCPWCGKQLSSMTVG